MLDKEVLKSVALQMVSGKQVEVSGKTTRVAKTSSQRLKTLRFEMNGREYQAIEQNPDKPSRWGKLAREGRHVVQFRDIGSGKYVAAAVDGEVTEYGKKK